MRLYTTGFTSKDWKSLHYINAEGSSVEYGCSSSRFNGDGILTLSIVRRAPDEVIPKIIFCGIILARSLLEDEGYINLFVIEYSQLIYDIIILHLKELTKESSNE